MYNKNRGKEVLKIYEQGKVFNQDAKGNINQESVLAGLIGGANKKPNWLEGLKAVDFYDVKGNVESIYKLVNKEVIFLQDRLKGFHPGKFSYIALKSKPSEVLGYLGSLDPEVMKTLDLQEEVIYFQLNCEQFLDAGDIQFKTFSKYPTSQRDLSFLISKEISSQSLQELIIKKSGKHFAGISVFDVYEGKRIDKGLKSISYNITWRSHKSTLVDEEIERIVENIILGVEKKFSGKIRQ
jgi:phenylalanyl-tRNA synthetase beta chain